MRKKIRLREEIDGEYVLRVARYAAADAITRGRDPVSAVLEVLADDATHGKLLVRVRELEEQIEKLSKAACPKCSAHLPISRLDLTVRTVNVLESVTAYSATLGELAALSESDLLKVRNCGRTSVNEIKAKLADYGLELAKEGS